MGGHNFQRRNTSSHPHCSRCHVPQGSSEAKWNKGRCIGMSWFAFYEECRREMEFRYGVKRVPKDYYKEHFTGATRADVPMVVRAIYRRLQAEGR